MAERDLPAMVDYILKSTNQQNLIYIGHSQGTSIGFAGFIRNQTLANQIKLFIAVAPVARVGNAQGLTKVLGRFLKSDVDVGMILIKGLALCNSRRNILYFVYILHVKSILFTVST